MSYIFRLSLSVLFYLLLSSLAQAGDSSNGKTKSSRFISGAEDYLLFKEARENLLREQDYRLKRNHALNALEDLLRSAEALYEPAMDQIYLDCDHGNIVKDLVETAFFVHAKKRMIGLIEKEQNSFAAYLLFGAYGNKMSIEEGNQYGVFANSNPRFFQLNGEQLLKNDRAKGKERIQMAADRGVYTAIKIIANLAIEEGDLSQATTIFRDAVARYPGAYRSFILANHLKRYPNQQIFDGEAMAWMQRAADLGLFEAKLNLAIFKGELFQDEEAVKLLNDALSIPGISEDMRKLAKANLDFHQERLLSSSQNGKYLFVTRFATPNSKETMADALHNLKQAAEMLKSFRLDLSDFRNRLNEHSADQIDTQKEDILLISEQESLEIASNAPSGIIENHVNDSLNESNDFSSVTIIQESSSGDSDQDESLNKHQIAHSIKTETVKECLPQDTTNAVGIIPDNREFLQAVSEQFIQYGVMDLVAVLLEGKKHTLSKKDLNKILGAMENDVNIRTTGSHNARSMLLGDNQIALTTISKGGHGGNKRDKKNKIKSLAGGLKKIFNKHGIYSVSQLSGL